MGELLLGLDVGTTSVGAGLFSPDGRLVAFEARRLKSVSSAPGRLEQAPAAIWRAALSAIRASLAAAGRTADDLAALGVTSQRTSVMVWDRRTGRPLSPLVIWSDLRGAGRAAELRRAGFMVAPQQAAAKLESLVAAVPAEARGRLAWGNVDSYLIFRLSGGAAHVTDRSQAWPTGYLDLTTMAWNEPLIAAQGLDPESFPRLVDTWGEIAVADPRAIGRAVPIAADVADQQAALIAHGGAPGAVKATFGTAAALDLATGAELVLRDASAPPFVVSSAGGETQFCIEGMVYTAGAALDWMGGLLGLRRPADLDRLAERAPGSGGVWFLPALQGLGAPHGDAARRAALGGLSLASGRAETARAALEGVAFRAREVFEHIHALAGRTPAPALGVDGGLTASRTFLQIQADLLGRPVRRHACREATACGAAICAGRGAGLLKAADAAGFVAYDPAVEPRIGADESAARFEAWRRQAYG